MIIGCASEALWARLCSVLGMPEAEDDPRYRVNRERVERREEVRELVERQLAHRPVAEWCEMLEEAAIPSGPIYGVPEMLDDPHMRARGFVVEQEHPLVGKLNTLACPIHLSDTPATYRLPPPSLGEHTDQVLSELGYGSDEIVRLHQEGAV
jgi:formyl-CoA transferase/CoA:oxalate CoA-transferase